MSPRQCLVPAVLLAAVFFSSASAREEADAIPKWGKDLETRIARIEKALGLNRKNTKKAPAKTLSVPAGLIGTPAREDETASRELILMGEDFEGVQKNQRLSPNERVEALRKYQKNRWGYVAMRVRKVEHKRADLSYRAYDPRTGDHVPLKSAFMQNLGLTPEGGYFDARVPQKILSNMRQGDIVVFRVTWTWKGQGGVYGAEFVSHHSARR